GKESLPARWPSAELRSAVAGRLVQRPWSLSYLVDLAHHVIDSDRSHRLGRGVRLDDVAELPVGTVAGRVGGTVQPHHRRAEGGGEVERSGVAADDEIGVTQKPGQLAQIGARGHPRAGGTA